MAIPLTTDWSKMRYVMFIVFSINALLASTVATGLATSGKQKRQLFREHLLPQQGGKIPDEAFDRERLLLNKYSQNGLTTDGFYIEQRHPDRHHNHKSHLPNTIKIELPPDNKHVAPPGRYYNTRYVDTTYLVSEPVTYNFFPQIRHYPRLPYIPQDSLQILRRFKYGKFDKNYGGNTDLSSNELHSKVSPLFNNLI